MDVGRGGAALPAAPVYGSTHVAGATSVGMDGGTAFTPPVSGRHAYDGRRLWAWRRAAVVLDVDAWRGLSAVLRGREVRLL